ncbi:hypothetical protein IC757_14465 [Wenzhouxiangella sp. AB-CW3]|uniref:hypothetical protein n=1 Tax=Wenzhouxiangella sp. AB-CW3 TaxID=2771012 RepID=UPI00168AF000|nr:hypothetical protein [Wenzhouxiangella sp. AB-CW3]QOC22204.1 hypothetical protein IC757_14465 [Wenzhouxiangella sp. AB-CW3]
MLCMLRALAGGLGLAVILIEALLAGLRLLTDSAHAHAALANGQLLPPAVAISLIAIWWLGAALGSALATALTGHRVTGWLIGCLLGLPMILMMILAGLPGPVLVMAGVPLAGAIAGAGLARRVIA